MPFDFDFAIDRYAHLPSPLQRWDTRYKLVGLFALMVSFAFVQQLILLPVMGCVAMIIALLSRLPLRFFCTRLSYPAFFLIIVVLTTMLAAGETPFFQVGALTIYAEGLYAAVLIATRFVSILTVGIVLFGTAPFLTTVRAMYALGLPALLNDMILFFYRYLHDLATSFATMQTAMRLRGFQATRLNKHTLVTLASLTGSLLIRSYEQSERIYHAMLLRGYGQPIPRHYRTTNGAKGQATLDDKLALAGVLTLAVAFVIAESVLSH